MESINSNHAYNIFSKLLSKTAHTTSNVLANIIDSIACHQQISTQHISLADKMYTRQPTNYRSLFVLN